MCLALKSYWSYSLNHKSFIVRLDSDELRNAIVHLYFRLMMHTAMGLVRFVFKSHANQGCIHLIINTVKTVMLRNIITI